MSSINEIVMYRLFNESLNVPKEQMTNDMRIFFNQPEVQEFLDLAKKVIIDKQKLSDQESRRLKELYSNMNVKAFIEHAKHRHGNGIKPLISFLVANFSAFLGSAFLMGASIISGMFIGLTAGLVAAIATNKYFSRNEIREIKQELKDLGLKQ